VGGLDDKLTSLRVELMARMDRLQNTLTTARDDLAVNMGAVDHMARSIGNVRDDVRQLSETLSVYIRRLKSLEDRFNGLTGEDA
jgi:hypothetical protein